MGEGGRWCGVGECGVGGLARLLRGVVSLSREEDLQSGFYFICIFGRLLQNEDLAGLMPLAECITAMRVLRDLVGSGAVVAEGAGDDGGVVGDPFVRDNQYMLAYFKHLKIPPAVGLVESVVEPSYLFLCFFKEEPFTQTGAGSGEIQPRMTVDDGLHVALKRG